MSINYNPGIVTSGLVTYLDAANPKSFSPNVHPKPTDIFAWCGSVGVNTGSTLRDTSVTDSPVKGVPLKLTSTGTDCYVASYNSSTWNITPAVSGQTWTVSFYAKASVATTSLCYIFGANSSGVYIEAYSNYSSITTSWQRFSFSNTLINASTAYLQFRLGCNVNGGIIWFDGLQIELASTATTFNPKANSNRANILDLSGNSNTGTLNNYPAFNTSNNGSLTFNGSTNYISVGSNANWGFGQNGTIEQLVYINGNSGTNNRFWCVNNNSSSLDAYLNGATYNVYFHGGTVGTTTTIPSGQWVHLIVIYNAGTISVYFNGVSQALTGTTTGYNITNSGALYIGQYSGGGGYFLNAQVGIFKVYNRALSAAEIIQNFNALRGRYGI